MEAFSPKNMEFGGILAVKPTYFVQKTASGFGNV
jgi:hypothetical protein